MRSNNIILYSSNKNRLLMLIIVLFLLFNNVESQNREEKQNMAELPETETPSKGVIIIVFSIMFTLVFLLLVYVRFCRVSPLQLMYQNPQQGPTRSSSRSVVFTGVDRKVIETLPFFKFSSLKGSREGLECTVCLSKFEDEEILRLLPKCKHGFHMNCIDTWLQNHSTCPLCRYKVEEVDIKNFANSLSSRFLRVPSNLSEDPNLEIFIQREPSSRRKHCKKDEELLVLDQGGVNSNSGGGNSKWKNVHVVNHKILISDVVTRRRWSDLNSSDLLSLNCEMLNDICSTRFSSHTLDRISCNDDEEENSFTALNPVEKRSMSEIANVPRFAEIGKKNGIREERLWRIWLPIARRTVQWFAGQERNSVELEHKPLASNV